MFLSSAAIANVVTQKLFGLDLLGAIPGAAELLQRLNANPNVQVIARNHEAAMPGFIAAMQAKLKAAK